MDVSLKKKIVTYIREMDPNGHQHYYVIIMSLLNVVAQLELFSQRLPFLPNSAFLSGAYHLGSSQLCSSAAAGSRVINYAVAQS